MLASTSQHALKTSTRRAAAAIEISVPSSSRCKYIRGAPESSSCHLRRRHASSQVAQMNRQDFMRPRSEPWSFKSDHVQYHRSLPLAQCNMQLQAHAESGRAIDALMLCSRMKREGVRPDRVTYNCLLHALSAQALVQEAWAAYCDMQAMGINPDIETFNTLLHGVRFLHPHAMFYILQLMEEHGLEPDTLSYSHIIRRYAMGDNLELALQRLAEMNAQNLTPTLKVAQLVILLATELGFARLGLDMAVAFEQSSVRRLDADVWVNILDGCAKAFYVDGVEQCWKKVVTDLNITPDEGLCLEVLHTAARHGHPTLAADVVKQLEVLGVQYQAHHLEPLLEAFVANGQIKEAFKILELIRSSGLHPTRETTSSILRAIQRDPDTVDSTWAVLHDLRSEGDNVDVVAANVIIQAAVFLGDLQRAIGTYKSLSDLGVQPNIDTYNEILLGCIRAKHRDLGDKVFSEMKSASVKPNAETYDHLIKLCLTQAAYEDTFFYLEEMKGAGFVPTYGIYEAMIRKCVSVGDTRYQLAVEELTQVGYRVSPRLQSFIDSGGDWEGDGPQDEYHKRPPTQVQGSRRGWNDRGRAAVEEAKDGAGIPLS